MKFCFLFWASLITQLESIRLQCRRPWFDSWSGRSAGEGIGYPFQYSWASLVAHLVKNPPARQEIWVQCLGWGDPLEKGKAIHSSILAWKIPWTTVPGVAKSQTWRSGFHFSLFWISWASEHLTQALYPSRNGFNIYIHRVFIQLKNSKLERVKWKVKWKSIAAQSSIYDRDKLHS